MNAPFLVLSFPSFDASIRLLLQHDRRVKDILAALSDILRQDPYNLSRRHAIKKLSGVPFGSGRWRIRSGRYRLRYDIDRQTVLLYSFTHRKDAY